AAITDRTKAVMPVHLYGHPADMDALVALAAERNLAIFEDAAQAHGAIWQGAPVGTFGTFAMFSLYPTKNMTSGEGGMVSAGTEEVARNLRLLRNQGMERQYANEIIGFNARMTDIHAAIGRVQLTKLPGWTATRQANAAFLDAHLEGVVTPIVREGATHVYHQYTIRLAGATGAERDAFADRLRERGVGCGVYYPIPNHHLDSLTRYAPAHDLPVTEQAALEVLSLPVHPSLSEADLETITTRSDQYTIRLAGATGAERDAFADRLRERGVGCGVYYPIPNHHLDSLTRYAPAHDLPVTEQAALEVLSLPVHPSLSEADLETITT